MRYTFFVKALFDTRVTHSFISSDFVEQLAVEVYMHCTLQIEDNESYGD